MCEERARPSLEGTVFQGVDFEEVENIYEILNEDHKMLARKYPFAFYYSTSSMFHKDSGNGSEYPYLRRVAWVTSVLEKLDKGGASRRAVFYFKFSSGSWGEEEVDACEHLLKPHMDRLFGKEIVKERKAKGTAKLRLVVSN